MSNQLIIGFASEGPTDVRFLASIIQRTFEDVAFECESEIEILPLKIIAKEPGAFIDVVSTYARKADEQGVMVLCIHVDADAATDVAAFTQRIDPAFSAVADLPKMEYCQNLVAIVPVQMSEAWMLSDKNLLRDEIGTSKSNTELALNKNAENFADPKQAIENAIRTARQGRTQRRRRDLTLSELYQPIGRNIALESLNMLSSYKKFRLAVQESFRKLNYLH